MCNLCCGNHFVINMMFYVDEMNTKVVVNFII
jgi:hypothetical protein